MAILTPSQAARIARGVYRLREDSVSTVLERGQSLGCEDLFNVTESSRFQGRSGGLMFKALSGFGYIAEGKGPFQGDVLVVTRGTAMGVDWLTNLNIGMQLGPSGSPVHAGFNETWKSFRSDVSAFLTGKNPTTIHCVGHSLGGALAALNADFLSNIRAGGVKLYTFGAPRAGTFVFSRSLSQRIGSENIYRVSHPSDPVPMIPIFPFQHLPYDQDGLVIANSLSGLINIGAHGMEPSYIPGVEGKSWEHLLNQVDPGSDWKIKLWLDQAAAGGGSFMKGSVKLLNMIGKALLWVLNRAKDLLIGTIGTVVAVGATVLDQLAWLISRGTTLSFELAGHVKTLMGAIFRFLGRTVCAGVSLTVTFIRWVLDLLFGALSSLASSAISLIA